MSTDNTDIDLEMFVDMFDTAMNSQNPAVKKCFNNLLLIVALTHTSDATTHDVGPLRSLVNKVNELERRINQMRPLGSTGTNMYGPASCGGLTIASGSPSTWGGTTVSTVVLTGGIGAGGGSTYPIQ